VTDGAIVLCGGRSTRMGRDKASLPFGDETLLARVVRLVRAAVPEVVLVAREGQALPGGLEAVRDPAEGLGPLAGLATGFQALRADRAFVAACDLPLLQPALVQRLLDEAGDAEACVPRVDGVPMTACAVYRREAGVAAAALVAGGERRLRALLDRVRTRYVETEALRAADPGLVSFADCDTPEAYDRVLRKAGLVVPVHLELLGAWPVPAARQALMVSGANLSQVIRGLAQEWPGLVPARVADDWARAGIVVVYRGAPASDPLAPVRRGELIRLIRVSLDATPAPS
jgi:molybdopterin-guanine dinucleotide biosynthesis protein A